MIAGLYDCFSHWHKEGTVWILSDTHFRDPDLTKKSKFRPSDEELLHLLNSKIGKKDTVIHLGDVGDPDFAANLKGQYKILVAGNHDRGSTNYKGIFNEIYEGPLMIGRKLILSHEPIYNISWAFNLHGHIHKLNYRNDKTHYNVCLDYIDYLPINFNQWMKGGYLSSIQTGHRAAIDRATERAKRR